MNSKYLLDTNIIIALFANDPAVVERIAQSERVVTSAVCVGELNYGARKSTRLEENLNRITRLRSLVGVLALTSKTAEHYGLIKNELRAKGRPIPENDIGIAATAMEWELTLVTRDAHFQQTDLIQSEAW